MDNIKIKYIGHSTFLITTKSGKKIIIDPWLKDNPSCSEDVNSIGGIDYILITHGHFDHVGDTLDIIKNNPNSITIANFEMHRWLFVRLVRTLPQLTLCLGNKTTYNSAMPC